MSVPEINFPIREFDPKTIAPNSVLVVIGQRHSGKSTTIKNLLSHHCDIPHGLVISGTEHVNPFYEYFMPSNFIRSDVNVEHIEALLRRQAEVKRVVNTLHKSNDPRLKAKAQSIDPRTFLILDDCTGKDPTLFRKNATREVFMNGRHSNILFVVVLHYPLGILPDMRQSVDYAFLYYEPNMSNRERLYKNYAGVIPYFEWFNQLLDEYTHDYSCLVIRKCNSKDIRDKVFYYRGNPNMPPFRMGAQIYWDQDMKRRQETYKKDLDHALRVLSNFESRGDISHQQEDDPMEAARRYSTRRRRVPGLRTYPEPNVKSK